MLEPTANNAFVASGAADVEAQCGIFVDSSGAQAMVVSGGAKVNASPSFIKVVGGVSSNNQITPVPIGGAAVVADPLATSPAAPTYSGCDHTNFSRGGGAQPDINPGVYCGGITLSGSIVKFQPGNYILNGGGLTISGSAADAMGAGVMFYNTSNGFSYKPITVSGGGAVNLSAPTSGTYSGLLFFQDRSTSSSSQTQSAAAAAPCSPG